MVDGELLGKLVSEIGRVPFLGEQMGIMTGTKGPGRAGLSESTLGGKDGTMIVTVEAGCRYRTRELFGDAAGLRGSWV